MASEKKTAYGTAANDTSFRKTWDRSEYAAKASEAEAKSKEESKARYEAKLAGKKYHAPVDMKDFESTTSRTSRLDVASMVGKQTLVPAGAAIGKRGRGAGFYCADCDLTYKDNVQYIEHLNSKQHLVATGQSGEVKRATLEEVRQRLAWLVRRREEVEGEEKKMRELDLGERLKGREDDEMREREEKRAKRNEKRRKGADGKVKQEEDMWQGRLGIIS